MTSAAAEAMDRFERSFAPQFKRRPWEPFAGRLGNQMERLFRLTHRLYGWRFDFSWILERLVAAAVAGYAAHPRWLDKALTRQPSTGAEFWVALDSPIPGDPDELISQLSDLRPSHLHLRTTRLPKTRCRTLVEAGYQLVADLSLDHVPQSHPWVEDAIRGDRTRASYFIAFEDRSGPDAFGTQQRDLGGRTDGDSFSWHAELNGGRWVSTTHGSMNWDLDYRNPEVLAAMVDRLFELTTRGVTRVCLRGLPVLWKQEGTSSINLPEAHVIVQILAALVAVAAPDAALVADYDPIAFSGHLPPFDRFIAGEECRFGYEPLLAELTWEALDKADARRLGNTVVTRFPTGCVRMGSLQLQSAFPSSEMSRLDRALEEGDTVLADLEARRILAALAILFAASDVPEIDLGIQNEMGLPRPAFSDSRSLPREERQLGPHGLIWSGLLRLCKIKQTSKLSNGSDAIRLLQLNDSRVLGLTRAEMTVLINTSPMGVSINPEYLLTDHDVDLLSGDVWLDNELGPYGVRFLMESGANGYPTLP